MRYMLVVLLLSLIGCGRGPIGPQGVPGPTGASAQPCNVQEVSGGATVTCPNGSSSFIANGATGATGVTGAAGTIITVVQFCTGYTYSYPTTFPEQALCIAGNLYGVYDGGANDVFLSELPAGEYTTTSTSAPCNFSIAANCVVTDN